MKYRNITLLICHFKKNVNISCDYLINENLVKLDLKSMTQYGFTERPDSHAHADHAKTPTSQASTDTPIKVSMISLQKKMIR